MNGGTDIPSEHLGVFIAETEEQIAIWEENVLALEKDPTNTDLLNRLFRAVHTIKGSAGFVGCDELKAMVHELETTIQSIRDGIQELDPERLEILFDGLDATKLCIGGMTSDDPFDIDYGSLITRIKTCNSQTQFHTTKPLGGGSETEPARELKPRTVDTHTYVLDIEITADESEAYLRSLLIQSKLEDAGEVLGIDPPLEELRLREEGFRFKVTVETNQSPEALRKAADVDQASVLSLRNLTTETDGVTAESAEQRTSRAIAGRPHKMDEVIRVHVNKLDSMMNLVGELVVANSRFVSVLEAGREKHGELEILQDLQERTQSIVQIARDLQDTVMKVSMLPVATIFSRFHRVVRDLAKHSDKEIKLEVFGEETEIDKRIMDGISEPLIHLIRNAVDHGIENRQDRVAFGKDGTGTIRIGAKQEGDHICVILSDDGQGIDRKTVVAKAVEKGLLYGQDPNKLTDKEVFELLFVPGFSTASEVTDISGRGVGLDIVKKTVEELGGTVRVESTMGLGTTTTITLPLTTVIIDSMVVEAAGSVYAFPMSSVLEMIQPTRSELNNIQQGTVICLRDEVIATLSLAEVLWPGTRRTASSAGHNEKVTIIILDHDGRKVGLIVDRLGGKQEIVVKSLSKNYTETEGLIGATVMGSGRVALILDVKGLLDAYYRDRVGEKSSRESAGENDPEPPQTRTIESAVVEAGGDGEIEGEASKTSQSSIGLSNNSDLFALDVQETERIQEILVDGAINASRAMTDLLRHEVRVTFPDLKIVPLDRITEAFGGDEAPVGGILVEFGGDIAGAWVLLMGMDELREISDFLMDRPPGSTKEISETELSALKELGNILTASFVRSIADATDLDVRLMVPEISLDMCLSVIDSVLVRVNQPGNQVLLTEAEFFSMETQKGMCHLLILMEEDSTPRLLRALAKGIRGLYEKAAFWRRRYLSKRGPGAELGVRSE